MSTESTCSWKCGDMAEGHTHYSVLVREAASNKLLGRLTPDGGANSLKIHAAVFSKARAEEITATINDGGEYTAKVVPF